MGVLTLEEFRDELTFDLKNRSDQDFTDARKNLFINAGYFHITHPSVFRHRELQTTFTIALVSGISEYTFSPVGGIVTTAIQYVSHVDAAFDDPTARHTKLYPKDQQWFQSRTRNSGGVTREYFTRGDSLIVSPVPGANEVGTVVVVGAIREPTTLVDGATTEIATRWDEILVLASRWRAEVHLGYRDMAETTKMDLVGLINEYKDHEQLHGEDWDWQSGVITESSMETV